MKEQMGNVIRKMKNLRKFQKGMLPLENALT